jgi:hypothetical protein
MAAADSIDRRLSPRRKPGFTEALRRIRSRTGREFDVVDVSHSGLLVEGRARLLPNTHLDIHIVTRTGRVLIRCRVVRSFVWYLESDLVRYRVGLAFDRVVDTSVGYSVLGPGSTESPAVGTDYPAAHDDSTGPGIVASSA